MKVIEVPIKDIKIGKLYREELGDINGLAETIKDKGVLQPITLDTRYKLIFGKRRYEAAKLVGLKTIPAIIRKTLTEMDARECELIENIARKNMTWQEQIDLQKRIFELKKAQDPTWSVRKQGALLDTSKSQVHRQMELAEAVDLIPELRDYDTEDKAYKALKKFEESVAVAALTKVAKKQQRDKTGWAEHHYIIKDVFEGLSQCQPGAADFAEVDPPYGIDLNARKERQGKQQLGGYTEVDVEKYPAFLRRLAKSVHRVLRSDSFMIWWYSPEWYQILMEILQEQGFGVSVVPAIWTKGIAGQTASPDTQLGSSYESFLLARKGKPHMRKPGRSNVFDFKPQIGANKIHQTEKPIELYVELLSTFCYPNHSILVPFLGSGNTLRAAYSIDMLGWGYDLDPMIKNQFVMRVNEDFLARGEETRDTPTPSSRSSNGSGKASGKHAPQPAKSPVVRSKPAGTVDDASNNRTGKKGSYRQL